MTPEASSNLKYFNIEKKEWVYPDFGQPPVVSDQGFTQKQLLFRIGKSSEQSREKFGYKSLTGILQGIVLFSPIFNFTISDPDKIPPPPGTEARPSDQGFSPTCTSHAVGKAVVQLLHEKHINCTQEDVIDRLVELKQGANNREWPHVFNGVTLDLKVWKRDEEENKFLTNIYIGVFQSTGKEPSIKTAVNIHL